MPSKGELKMEGKDILILAAVGVGAFWLFGGFNPAAATTTAVATTPSTGTTTTNAGTTTNAAAAAGTATNKAPATHAVAPVTRISVPAPNVPGTKSVRSVYALGY